MLRFFRTIPSLPAMCVLTAACFPSMASAQATSAAGVTGGGAADVSKPNVASERDPARDGTDEAMHPVAEDVAKRIGGDGAFFLHVTLVCKPDLEEDFLEVVAMATEKTRLESANRRYQLIRDADVDHRYRLCEEWSSVAGLNDHLQTDYITKLLAEFDQVLAEPLKLEVFQPLP